MTMDDRAHLMLGKNTHAALEETQVEHFGHSTCVGGWANKIWPAPEMPNRKRFAARYMPTAKQKRIKYFPTRRAAIDWLQSRILAALEVRK